MQLNIALINFKYMPNPSVQLVEAQKDAHNLKVNMFVSAELIKKLNSETSIYNWFKKGMNDLESDPTNWDDNYETLENSYKLLLAGLTFCKMM